MTRLPLWILETGLPFRLSSFLSVDRIRNRKAIYDRSSALPDSGKDPIYVKGDRLVSQALVAFCTFHYGLELAE